MPPVEAPLRRRLPSAQSLCYTGAVHGQKLTAFLRRAPLAAIGCTAYVLGFAVPTPWDVSLIILAILTIVVGALGVRNDIGHKSPLVLPVIFFAVASIISTALSQDIFTSIRLSAPLLPSLLIFYLITWYFSDKDHVRMLFAAFCFLALAISSISLAIAVLNADGTSQNWISDFPSPILVVPNDLTLLAIVAPLSFALFHQGPRRPVGIIAAISILLSVIAIVVFQSRGALLALLVAISVFYGLVWPRLALGIVAVVMVLVIAVDATLGFPLLLKLASFSGGRIPLWFAAWGMFVDAPLTGFGPHTYALFYRFYLVTADIPNWVATETRFTPWPHNLYLEVLAEQGLMGLAALLLMLARGLQLAWRLQYASTPDTRPYGSAALSSLTAFCCAAFFELTFLRMWVAVILFGILGMVVFLSYSNRRDAIG